MLEDDRQYVGFAPPAPLNRVHPVKFTPVTAKHISLGYPPGVQLGCNVHPPLAGLPRVSKRSVDPDIGTEAKRRSRPSGSKIPQLGARRQELSYWGLLPSAAIA